MIKVCRRYKKYKRKILNLWTIFENFLMILIVVFVAYIGVLTYNKSQKYFSNNELWGSISDKYNTTKGDVIAKQKDSFTITTVYDSTKQTRNTEVLSGNSGYLKSNNKAPKMFR